MLFITEDGIYQTAYGQKKPADQNLIDMVREENPDALVLNSLAFDEALQIYTDWDLETYEDVAQQRTPK